jgi:hypothetical protein
VKSFTELRSGFVEIADARAVYSEAAFRYFMALELRRSRRVLRPLLLVLVSLHKRDTSGPRLSPALAGMVFRALERCVREVDFVGWHRDQEVAGAVLSVHAPTAVKTRELVCSRVTRELNQRLTTEESARLHVRAIELGRRTTR